MYEDPQQRSQPPMMPLGQPPPPQLPSVAPPPPDPAIQRRRGRIYYFVITLFFGLPALGAARFGSPMAWVLGFLFLVCFIPAILLTLGNKMRGR